MQLLSFRLISDLLIKTQQSQKDPSTVFVITRWIINVSWLGGGEIIISNDSARSKECGNESCCRAASFHSKRFQSNFRVFWFLFSIHVHRLLCCYAVNGCVLRYGIVFFSPFFSISFRPHPHLLLPSQPVKYYPINLYLLVRFG